MTVKSKSPREWFSKASVAAKATLESVKTEYRESNLNTKVNETAARAKQLLEESGVKDKALLVTEKVSGHLDTLSGQKLLELVEQRLTLQAQYNDILATKLEEALNRINELEKFIKLPRGGGRS